MYADHCESISTFRKVEKRDHLRNAVSAWRNLHPASFLLAMGLRRPFPFEDGVRQIAARIRLPNFIVALFFDGVY